MTRAPFLVAVRLVAGGVFGAGLASAAQAAEPLVFGPETVRLFGADIPIWSALFGLIGVVMARRVAPATAAGTALGPIGNAALTILLACGVLALIISGEKRPLVALGWSIGLGFSGLGFIEMVAKAVVTAATLAMDGFAQVAGRAAAAWAQRRGDGS
jgi:hypothetical protein